MPSAHPPHAPASSCLPRCPRRRPRRPGPRARAPALRWFRRPGATVPRGPRHTRHGRGSRPGAAIHRRPSDGADVPRRPARRPRRDRRGARYRGARRILKNITQMHRSAVAVVRRGCPETIRVRAASLDTLRMSGVPSALFHRGVARTRSRFRPTAGVRLSLCHSAVSCGRAMRRFRCLLSGSLWVAWGSGGLCHVPSGCAAHEGAAPETRMMQWGCSRDAGRRSALRGVPVTSGGFRPGSGESSGGVRSRGRRANFGDDRRGTPGFML